MSHQPIVNQRLTIPQLHKRAMHEPLVMLTAYTAPQARILDAHCDMLLVGDSLAMVLYGEENTLSLPLDVMMRHARAVVRHSARAIVVVDMPFGSYQESPAQAFRNAAWLLGETGATAVKLEGGAAMAETVAFLTARGVPVMAHIGLTPQYVHTLGGYRYQGRTLAQAQQLCEDARLLEQAGAFACVLECVEMQLTAHIHTQCQSMLVIGIGSGVDCDGQVLVCEDMIGLTPQPARFVQQFGEAEKNLDAAVRAYAQAVRNKTYPLQTHGVMLDDTSHIPH